MNTISISGNLAAEPEIRQVGDNEVTEFRIGHNTKRRRNGREEEITSWFNVERWGEAFANFAREFLRKGAKVYVTGSVEIDQWENNGKSGTTVKIKAFSVDLETWPDNDQSNRSNRSNSNRSNSNRSNQKPEKPAMDPAFDPNDIPF